MIPSVFCSPLLRDESPQKHMPLSTIRQQMLMCLSENRWMPDTVRHDGQKVSSFLNSSTASCAGMTKRCTAKLSQKLFYHIAGTKQSMKLFFEQFQWHFMDSPSVLLFNRSKYLRQMPFFLPLAAFLYFEGFLSKGR